MAKLDSILASIPAGILATDASGRATLQNPEASRILGISWETLAGRHVERVLGRQHPVTVVMREALATGRVVTTHGCELLQFPVGRRLIVDVTAAPLGLEGDSEGVVVTLSDRTLGRDLEEGLLQRRRTEEFAQLAAGIAHEVRNPLGGIRGAAQLLLQRLPEGDLRRLPELIRDETDRIRRLLDDLAELTRGGELRPRPTNLHRVLDDLLQLQAQDEDFRDVRFVREYDPSIPDLELDPDRIAQVVLNLLRNAAQAQGGKGRVVVRTRVAARAVHLEIEDEGPGIPEEDLPHIFTPFFTRRSSGTGLGLAIAQHWTVRHGGRIRAGRRAPGGTQLRVTLPLPGRHP